MDGLQDRISLAVRHYLVDARMNQRGLASAMNTTVTKMQSRIAGKTEWRASDIEKLANLGVKMPDLNQLTDNKGVER